MTKFDNQKHPFIYDRTTGEKIPVSKEVRDAYYNEAARIRMKAQAHGQCVCPQSKVWACDGDCLVCEYRRSGDMASLDIPVGEDGEDTLLDMVLDEVPSIESVIADRDLLDRLFARLRELDPDADTIISMWFDFLLTVSFPFFLPAVRKAVGLFFLWERVWLRAVGTFALLCFVITFHAIFNIFVNQSGAIFWIGSAFPLMLMLAYLLFLRRKVDLS